MNSPLFLSRLRLNPSHPAVRREQRSNVAMHRRLLTAFPDVPEARENRALFGLLFRVEPERAPGPIILAQSTTLPDWTALPPGYLLREPNTSGADMRRIDSQIAALVPDQILRFRLRASPIRSVKQGPGRRSRRTRLADPQDVNDWLARKAEASGFALLGAPAIIPEPPVQGTRDGSGRLTLTSTLFEGVLRIIDPELLGQAIRSGIGPGKAYGLGLLSLAPAPEYTP